MKKILLSALFLVAMTGFAMAQDDHGHRPVHHKPVHHSHHHHHPVHHKPVHH